uniref:Ig-like domain-containing protein n=1 Tax=Moschus moschiferus TaxID=68415 RepID=A0A8C6DFX4_MOSMO
MALLEAVLFSSLWSFGLGQLTLEQPEVSVTGTREKSVIMSCKVFSKDFSKDYIHWYRQKPDHGLEQLLYVSAAFALNHLGGKKNKLEAKKDALSSTSTLKISFLEKEDEATYYCAGWSSAHSVGVSWITHTRTITRSVLTTSSTQAATGVAELGALPK